MQNGNQIESNRCYRRAMASSFDIQVEPDCDLVTITLSGFFKPEDVARFEQARNRAHFRLTCGPNQHLTLVDMRGMQIQSQESVAAFARVLRNPSTASKRIAIVVTQSLARMQVQRAAEQRDIHYFADDLAAARRWLLADEALPA